MQWRRQLKRVLPAPAKSGARYARSHYEEIKFRAIALGDHLGVLSPDQIYDEGWFQEMAADEQLRRDAREIVSVLDEEFSPESVLDVGCGVGLYLSSFENLSADIWGVEGSQAAIENALVDARRIEQHDLRQPYYPSQRYDLVLNLEVAEHIPEQYADVLVDSLIRGGNVIVFTAATPGQGGSHHVNEQPRSYWKQKFEQRGYNYEDTTTTELVNRMEQEKADWVPDNLFVFTK